MKKVNDISNASRNAITIGLALVFILGAMQGLITGASWIGRTFPGFLVLGNGLVPTVAAPGWEGLEEGIRFGDIIKEVDGQPVDSGDEINTIAASAEPGRKITYTIDRRGEEHQVVVPASEFGLRDYLLIFVTLIVFGAAFYAVSMAVFFLRPNSADGRAFLVNGVLVGITFCVTPVYVTSHDTILPLITLPLIGPSFVLLTSYFPEPNKYRKYYLLASWVPALPIVVAYFLTFNNVHLFTISDTAMLVHLTLSNLLSLYIVGQTFYSSKDPVTAQKAKIVVFGISVGFMICLIFVIGTLILKDMSFFWFLPLSILCLPMSIAYAILKNNLFDVDVLIRRGAGYMVSSVVVVIIFLLVSGLLGIMLQELTGRSSQISAVAATLLVVGLFRPIHNRVQTSIERRFYHEQYEYHHTIKRASKVLARIIDKERLLNELLDTIMESVRIERGLIMLKDQESDTYETATERDYSTGFSNMGFGPDIPDGGKKSLEKLSAREPLFFYMENMKLGLHRADVEKPGLFGKDQEKILDLMDSLGVVLIIPIVYEFRVIGSLCLGPKSGGQWYSKEDIELIQTLMEQAAISIENAKSVEDMKRMVEYETSYRELKKLDEMKDNFLSMVSHDLRTPMTGILAYASILKEGMDSLDREKKEKYLDVIIQQGQRMTRLVNDLLDIQRFESEKHNLQTEELDLSSMISESMGLFEAAATEKHITLEDATTNEKVYIRGNRDRLMQALSNLIGNAVKFTPENGTIETGIDFSTREGNEAARVYVKDNGPGIPPQYHEKLFEKFQQGDKLVRDKSQGSGLGLALVKDVIEAHDGRVGLASEPGEGSTFFFFLPVLRRESGVSDAKKNINR